MSLIIRKFGLRDYTATFVEMKNFTAQRNEFTPDEVWLLEHNHVFTQGKAGKTEHILAPGDVPVIQVDRGGQVTYHGPGQMMIYVLMNLRRANLGVKKFVQLLEQAIIDTLAAYNVQACAREEAPGIYVDGAKICSLGLKITKGCSYHGLAFNVTTNLDYFKRINPCGFKNLAVTKVAALVQNFDYNELETKIAENLAKNLGFTKIECVDYRNPQRKPKWIRSKLLSQEEAAKIRHVLQQKRLVIVCQEAACPNRNECFSRGTATFMIMGDICTRNCHFCNVKHGKPEPLDITEPERLAQTVMTMNLKYVVITSVDRDDLRDNGALHFAHTIQAIKALNPEIKVEILVPDFKHCMNLAFKIFTANLPYVFAHNIETVPRLYAPITPNRNYEISLELLQKFKQFFPEVLTKSGIMVGLGETNEEIIQVLADLRAQNVDMVTIGQYLQPSLNHAPVARFVTPTEFDYFTKIARQLGFKYISSGPMVRSSYYAEEQV